MCDTVDLEDPFDTTYYRPRKSYSRDYRSFVGVSFYHILIASPFLVLSTILYM